MTDPQGRSHKWISAETRRKENDFRGLMDMQVRACQGIASRYGKPGDPPYTFIDFHAGPGHLRDDAGNQFDGSPLIAAETLSRSELRYQTWHFERDPAVCAQLEAALPRPQNPGSTSAAVNLPFAYGVRRWLEDLAPEHEYRYGIAYADPWERTEGRPIPVEEFRLIAQHSPRMDLLVYVAANNHYKRAGLAAQGHLLIYDVAAVGKKYTLIRDPRGTSEQFTFILFSDYPFGEWASHRFYRLGTPDGDALLAWLSYTGNDLRRLGMEPLPMDGALW